MFSSIGPLEIGIIALVVILLFGVGKLSGLGRDLGSSVKEFRRAIKDEDKEKAEAAAKIQQAPPAQQNGYQQPPQQYAPPPAQQNGSQQPPQQYTPPPQQPAAAPPQQQPVAPQGESKNIF